MASSSSHALLLLSLISSVKATTFTLINNCPYTIWPAAVPTGGGRELIPSTNWTIAVADANNSGRFWARTNCSFDGPSGEGSCLAGDCAGILNCTAAASPPATLVEYSVYQYGDNDFYGISLVDGFNVPVEVRPYSIGGGGGNCSVVRCTADISGECPAELRSAGDGGGCDSACHVFKTDEYCCSNSSAPCEPTKYSSFFKNRCPQAYSYPKDDSGSTFMCGSGADYAVTFCP